MAGYLGGRKIVYNGDPATRPMKEKTREAVFSLLGGYLNDMFVLDLFGGTGILAMESISRGAQAAEILELKRNAVSTMVANLQLLNIGERIQVHNVDTLRWLRNIDQHAASWPQVPWVVFCCPPYRLWHEATEGLKAGILDLYKLSPSGSRIVTETESDFDVLAEIPEMAWDVRKYPPAHIGICT
ncbi:MAG: RsmD family RNA methyltransferase, partial [Planctomycetales bacterium]|nr:RsmD family RNA methyltransferase [Planctomycetales bacterium]